MGDSGGLCGFFRGGGCIGDVKRRCHGPWSSSCVVFHVVPSNRPKFMCYMFCIICFGGDESP